MLVSLRLLPYYSTMLEILSFTSETQVFMQKWFCALSLGLSCGLSLISLPLMLSTCAIGLGIFAVSISTLLFFEIEDYRPLDLRKAKEKLILNIVKEIAKKLNLPIPMIKIEKAQSTVNISAAVSGFPYEPTLYLSDELIDVFSKGYTQNSFEALVAHELSHLKHADPQINFILAALKMTIIFCIPILLVSTSLYSLSLLFSLSKLSVFLLGSEIAFAGFCRAKEKQADLSALHIVKDQQSVIRFIYDNYLQYLFYGKLVLENAFAGQTHILSDDPEVAKILKQTHRKLSNKTFIPIYKRLQQAQGVSAVSFINKAKTWLNTHPTLSERETCIKASF
ncbi:MAG: M48 family metalloprotease [Proteobacteria bacterium]|nr:M48 family metalloprotease [Pseudomonadota bacterium]